jgi:hypothetical protein
MDTFFQLLNLYWRDLITLEEFNQLNYAMANRLVDPVIYPRILLGHIGVRMIMSLTDQDYEAIHRYLSHFIIEYPELEPVEINFDRLIPLPEWIRDQDNHPRNHFPVDAGDVFFHMHLAVANFFQQLTHLIEQPPENNQENVDQAATPQINYEESTHNTAIERTVGVSIENLIKNHPQDLYVVDDYIDLYLRLLKMRLVGIIPQGALREAAIRCVSRLMSSEYRQFHAYSGMSLPSLLSLIYLQIEFRPLNLNINEAIKSLARGLFEIQRGGNLDENALDDNQGDAPICLKGSYHKLIECMVGILPECELSFVTIQTATLRLPVMVREQLSQWFFYLASSSRLDHLAEFFYLIQIAPEHILERLWPQLFCTISHRFLVEFSELSLSADHFNKIVEVGLYTEIQAYPDCRGVIINSPAYYKLEQGLLYRSGLFANKTTRLNDTALKDACNYQN